MSSESALSQLVATAREQLPYNMQAFEQIVVLQYERVRRLAYGVVGDDSTARSVAQDALLRAMHGLPKLADDDRFESWLSSITVNVARTALAREKREREKRALYAAEVPVEVAAPRESPSFAELVDGLDVDERAIVSLRILDDLEFGEIADITGQTLSATKMRYYRALNKIKPLVE